MVSTLYLATALITAIFEFGYVAFLSPHISMKFIVSILDLFTLKDFDCDYILRVTEYCR